MAPLLAFACRPGRALSRVLGMCGLALALGGTVVATPATALAAPDAALTRPRVAKAKKSSAKKSSAKKTSARKSSRSASSRTSSRRTRAGRTRHAERAERPAPRPSADLMSPDDVVVPPVVLPELSLASAAPGSGNPFTLITRSATSLLDGLVARARGQLGTRYVYGATSPDAALDCSSFARYVMEALGVRLPRTANQQARVGAAVPRDLAALRPGDLLTFGSPRHTSHVGIYLGQGRFIHASVKSGQVIETTIERNRSLFRRWQGARRLLAGATDSLPTDGSVDAAGLGVGPSGG